MASLSRLPLPSPDAPPGLTDTYANREAQHVLRELRGEVRLLYVWNDGSRESGELLLGLKAVFSRCLPNMPRAYIVRLLFDPRHRSVVACGPRAVLGGITYRPFPRAAFAEIAFCAVAQTVQVSGFGTRLMNACKEAARDRDGALALLTYADNAAVGYFAKQGFSKTVSLDRERWHGTIKDYDGGTLMECRIEPDVPYANVPGLLQQQRERLQAIIQTQTKAHVVHPGLDVWRWKETERKTGNEEAAETGNADKGKGEAEAGRRGNGDGGAEAGRRCNGEDAAHAGGRRDNGEDAAHAGGRRDNGEDAAHAGGRRDNGEDAGANGNGAGGGVGGDGRVVGGPFGGPLGAAGDAGRGDGTDGRRDVRGNGAGSQVGSAVTDAPAAGNAPLQAAAAPGLTPGAPACPGAVPGASADAAPDASVGTSAAPGASADALPSSSSASAPPPRVASPSPTPSAPLPHDRKRAREDAEGAEDGAEGEAGGRDAKRAAPAGREDGGEGGAAGGGGGGGCAAGDGGSLGVSPAVEAHGAIGADGPATPLPAAPTGPAAPPPAASTGPDTSAPPAAPAPLAPPAPSAAPAPLPYAAPPSPRRYRRLPLASIPGVLEACAGPEAWRAGARPFRVVGWPGGGPEAGACVATGNPPGTVPAMEALVPLLNALLKKLGREPDAWPFLQPVPAPEVPDYYDVIKTPIDIQTMRQRLDSGAYYVTLELFVAEVDRMFENARLYNASDTYFHKAATRLGASFHQWLAQCVVYDE